MVRALLALLAALSLSLAGGALVPAQQRRVISAGGKVDLMLTDARRLAGATNADSIFAALVESTDKGNYANVRDLAQITLVLELLEAQGPTASVASLLTVWARSAQSLGEGQLAAAAALELYVQRADIQDTAAVWLFFRLCYLWDELDEPDRAMAACRRANGIVRDHITADMQDPILELGQYLNGQRPFLSMPSLPPPPEGEPTIVFVMGMPRTGTSLLEQMLGMAPGVFPAGETSIFLSEVLQDLETKTSERYSQEQVEADPFVYMREEGVMADYARRVRARFRQLMGPSNSVVIDKRTTNFMYMPFLARLLPDAKFLICDRDRRDVALSLYFQYFNAWSSGMSLFFSPEDIKRYYYLYDELMATGLEDPGVEWGERALRMSYEDLVKDPEAVLRDVMHFIGVEWTPDVLRFYETARSPATASNDMVKKPLSDKSVGKWRRYEKYMSAFIDPVRPE